MCRQQGKKLGLAILLALSVGGGLTPFSVDAAQTESTFSTAITGNASADTAYVDSGVLDAQTGTYNFTAPETTINEDTHKISGGMWMGRVTNAVSGAYGANPVVIDMHHNTLNINVNPEKGSATGIAAIGSGDQGGAQNGKVTIQNAGNMTIMAKGTGQVAGLFVNSGGEIYIDNTGSDENGNPYVLKVESQATNMVNSAAIKSMNGMLGMSKITITGLVDVVSHGQINRNYASGEGVSAVGSTITIGGGNIFADEKAWCAIRAYGDMQGVSDNTGTVNVNILRDETGNITGAGNNKTTITGDFVTNGSMTARGQINVGLNGADSFWKGRYSEALNDQIPVRPGKLGKVNVYMKNGAHWDGYTNGPTTLTMEGTDTYWKGFSINKNTLVTMTDGATWHNTFAEDQDMGRIPRPVQSQVGYLVSHGGVLDMTGKSVFDVYWSALDGNNQRPNMNSMDDKYKHGSYYVEKENGISADFTIHDYTGDTTILYRRDADNPTEVLGGNVTIEKAAEGSTVTLKTDAAGLDYHDPATAAKTLHNLANKLYYTEIKTDADGNAVTDENGNKVAAENLSGQVEIAEGLTASSAAMKVGNLTFGGTNGQADVDTSSIRTVDPAVYYGNYETAMMRGAKAAMLSTAMAWQATSNDIQKRLGDLRIGNAGTDDGIWAKVGRGRMSYDKNNTNFHSTFTDYYVGYDKKVGNSNWRLGAAFSKLDGKDHYERGSHGDSDVYAGYVYASQMRPDNSYIDIVGRVGHLKNEYSVYNDSGNKLHGDYSTNGFALSAEYGKRFQNDNGFYVEPQAEVIWSKLASKDYDAHSDYNGSDDLHINQHTYNSFIGRLGLGIGVKKDRFSAYAKASLLHEFDGGFNTDYTADGCATKSTHMDFGDTWVAMDLGTTVALSDRTNLFGYFERTFGSDIRTDWRYNVGLRFNF